MVLATCSGWPWCASMACAADEAWPRILGAGSCAASSCHGGEIGTNHRGSEYALWREYDPHARDVLRLPSAQRITEKYGLTGRATEQRQCLTCHVTSSEGTALEFRVSASSAMLESWVTADAVSCESCHGPAEQWLSRHYRGDWRALVPSEKTKLGFISGRTNLIGRIEQCAECHVGGPGREVDHDLLAAGHPRLNFELTSHLARLPKHWYRRGNQTIDNEATTWTVGQIIASKQALEQLAARSRDSQHVWPEYSEHKCYACHHDLDEGPRSAVSRRTNSSTPYEMSEWHIGLLPALLSEPRLQPNVSATRLDIERTLPAVVAGLRQPTTFRKTVGDDADKLAASLRQWAQDVESRELLAQSLRNVLPATLPSSGASTPDWDRAAQWYLLAAAIRVDERMNHTVSDNQQEQRRLSLHRMLSTLRFPRDANSPLGWDSSAANSITAELRHNFSHMTADGVSP